MNSIHPLTWRKGLILSATFFCSIFIIAACKKKVNPIGQSAIDQSELLNSAGVDTFSLTTFTYFDDSVISDNAPFGLLGSYNDPVFGKFNAELYTQFRLGGLNPDFGNMANITVDSFVLGLEYVGSYGSSGIQSIEVYELTQDLHIDSTYYSFTTKTTNAWNLVSPGTGSINLNPTNLTVIGQDTVDSQLRIRLNTSKAKTMLIEAASGSGSFVDNEAFLSYFKGLHIKTNNGFQSSGEGGVFYFNLTDPLSKLTIYYTQSGVQKTFDFLINSSCADFNHVDIDTSGITGTQVQAVVNDTISGQSEFYSQAFGRRAVVHMDGINNIPVNAIIHKATLELPVQYQTGAKYSPGFDISVSTLLAEGSTDIFAVTTAEYNDFSKSFKIDLRSYVQAVVSGELKNTGLIFSPLLFNTSADRIIFNGPQSSNKAKPRLSILYTEF